MGTGTWPTYCESSMLSGAKIVLKTQSKLDGWVATAWGLHTENCCFKDSDEFELGREYLIVNRG